MYLPHTLGGEANLEEYYKPLKDLDRNMQEVKQKIKSLVLLPEWMRRSRRSRDKGHMLETA